MDVWQWLSVGDAENGVGEGNAVMVTTMVSCNLRNSSQTIYFRWKSYNFEILFLEIDSFIATNNLIFLQINGSSTFMMSRM